MEILARYGEQQTFYFPLITSGGTDFQTTWTPAASETQVSIDGGAFANTTNTPSHEGNGLWSLTMTAAELSGERIVVSVIDAGTDVEDQALIISTEASGILSIAKTVIVCEVETATTAATNTTMEAIRLAPNVTEEATADHMIGRLITFRSGALLGQQTKITDYALQNSNEFYTFEALAQSETASDGDIFVVT